MVKLFDFEYHVGIWFKYDRFGSNQSMSNYYSIISYYLDLVKSREI